MIWIEFSQSYKFKIDYLLLTTIKCKSQRLKMLLMIEYTSLRILQSFSHTKWFCLRLSMWELHALQTTPSIENQISYFGILVFADIYEMAYTWNSITALNWKLAIVEFLHTPIANLLVEYELALRLLIL